jgi:hypothetical protein
MKYVNMICALTLVLHSNAGFAKGKHDSVASLAAQLGKVLESDSVTQLKPGRNARQLIEEKYMADRKINKLDEDFSFSANVDSIQSSDGDGLGTATLRAAQDFTAEMISNYLYTDKDGVELSKQELGAKIDKASNLLERLSRAGAAFGYDANGSGVCGVNYTTLYVIDLDEGAIHEYSFVGGPC